MTLMVRMNLVDICLIEKIINKYMKEKNIKNIDEIEKPEHESIIQERYNKIIKEIT
jgi:hypothetical protein